MSDFSDFKDGSVAISEGLEHRDGAIEACRDMLVVWEGIAHPALAYREGSPAWRIRRALETRPVVDQFLIRMDSDLMTELRDAIGARLLDWDRNTDDSPSNAQMRAALAALGYPGGTSRHETGPKGAGRFACVKPSNSRWDNGWLISITSIGGFEMVHYPSGRPFVLSRAEWNALPQCRPRQSQHR